MRKGATVRFESVLRAITTNRCVEVPAGVGRALGLERRAPVRARVLGIEFDSTLLPSRAGGHRIFVPSTVWKTRGVAVGDAIPVEVWRISEPPVILPAELAPFARSTPALAAAYARITPADRRQIAKYFGSAHSAETLRRRAAEIARRLLSPPKRRVKPPNSQ
ncbi:MAG: DUF1905 domain-containing protein [Vicinamibacteria bacterium]|nr:DUF1905 domain-containing protein [Vicinamibacteria bacterium]